MAKVIKAPSALVTSGFTVFLSGSIDMGRKNKNVSERYLETFKKLI